MSRGLKIVIGAAVAVVVIVVVVFVFVLSNLGSIIKAAVEEAGSEVTRVEVRLADAEVSLTEGTGVLRGLTVANPQGYQTPHAFELGAISIKLDIATIRQDPIVIKEVRITKPVVTYELGGPAGSNIDAIKKNVAAYSGGAKSTGEAKGDAKGDEGPKIIIEHLYVSGGTVNVSATALKGKTLSAGLPNIHLKDIGKKKGGASPGEVAERVINSLTQGATTAVAGLNLDKLLGAAGAQAKEAVSKAKEAVKGATGGAAGAVEEGAKDVGGRLKKLLGD